MGVVCHEQNNFERNQHDVFIFKKADLGKLTKIQIGHDSSLDAWHLARVEVTKMGPVPERTVFPCDRCGRSATLRRVSPVHGFSSPGRRFHRLFLESHHQSSGIASYSGSSLVKHVRTAH
jgi:hypothetical protein